MRRPETEPRERESGGRSGPKIRYDNDPAIGRTRSYITGGRAERRPKKGRRK